MGMKEKYLMLAMSAIAMAGSSGVNGYTELSPERDLKAEQDKINLARGLKKFNIDGNEVWAINEERARRKAKPLTR